MSRWLPFFVKLSIVAARHLHPGSTPAPARSVERPRATVPAPPSEELLAETGAIVAKRDSSAPTVPPNPIDLELLAFLPELTDLPEPPPAPTAAELGDFGEIELLPSVEAVADLPELEELGPADEEEVDSSPGDSSGVFESCFSEGDLIERGGSLRSVPRVILSPAGVKALPLDSASGFLLGLMDGLTDVESLMDISGLSRDAVIGSVCLLRDHSVIRFD
ncbi:MAG: hypothetical protein U0235_34490 [Polyangiaceae bacterium]